MTSPSVTGTGTGRPPVEAVRAARRTAHRRTRRVVVLLGVSVVAMFLVEVLLGNPAKAKATFGWEAQTSLEALITEMVDADIKRLNANV